MPSLSEVPIEGRELIIVACSTEIIDSTRIDVYTGSNAVRCSNQLVWPQVNYLIKQIVDLHPVIAANASPVY